jgi:epoxyqueuosine reductase
MKEAIRRRARELGFDDCRVTTAERADTAQELERWLGQGRHGEMAYLARNAPKREDPWRVLAGAKSVVTLAVSYATAGDSPRSTVNSPQSAHHLAWAADKGLQIIGSSRPLAGRGDLAGDEGNVQQPGMVGRGPWTVDCGLVARYARYRDYHEVIGERLKELTRFVNEVGGEGTRSLWYVDTGPVLERDLAQRAGLGFVGKHTNVISRQLGNWIFLGEILTTLELEPDAPEKNRCGSCTRCIEACPTGAIRAPFQLDARRCISYLTIELKGSIPVEFRQAIGNRIYGCDDCLAVCPWNRFAREGQMMKAYTRADLAGPDLLELLSLGEAEFRRRFAGTPMVRTKRRGLLRNVCVALGNTGDESALPALERAAADPDPLIAEHARWAVERIRGRGVGA